MKTFVDALQREVTISYPPKRIISLCPAITETLYYLQLGDKVVGRTRFCIHPQPEVEKAVNVGGTKDMKFDRIQDLSPDLIIAEKEENTKEMVELLEKHFPVYVFEIQSITNAVRMITDLGLMTDRENEARVINQKIINNFQAIKQMKHLRVAYVIWQNPYMVVGKLTYINSLLAYMGFTNPFSSFEARYPEVTIDDLRNANLDYLFLATEPFPFNENHLAEFKELLPNTTPIIVDGEMFWYVARIVEASSYFKQTFSDL